jgi:hypothetical protein
LCAEWQTFAGFLESAGIRPGGTTMGRYKDRGDYTPSNCKFMSRAEQETERRKKLKQAKKLQQAA